MHAPARDVVHRRLANQLSKTRGKCRTGHRDFVRQRLDCPWTLGFSMDEGDGVADLLVLKRTEPSGPGGWILRDPGSDRLNHQDVRETRDDGLATWTRLPGFDGHQAQRALNPLQLRRAPRVNADTFGSSVASRCAAG